MKRYLAVLAVAAVVAAGCGGGDDDTPGSPFEGDPPLAAEQPAEAQVIPFGQTHTMAGYLDITIKAPVPYERTEDDKYTQDNIPVAGRLEITITNRHTQEIHPDMVIGYSSASLNGQQVDLVSFTDLRHKPTVLLPGQTTTFDELVDVPVSGDFVFSVHWVRGYENGGYVYFPDEQVRFRGQVTQIGTAE